MGPDYRNLLHPIGTAGSAATAPPRAAGSSRVLRSPLAARGLEWAGGGGGGGRVEPPRGGAAKSRGGK